MADWIQVQLGLTFQLNADDIVVFAIGPTGGGKSLFVKEVTKSRRIKVGIKLWPFTGKVRAIRCKLTEQARSNLGGATQKNIVFVDTPSFHTGVSRDDEAERRMSGWLNKSKCKSTLVGIMYLHTAETDPTLDHPQRHLTTFARTFPEGIPFPKRLHALLSYEGQRPPPSTELRKELLEKQLKGLKRLETSMHPEPFHKGDSEKVWAAVVSLFSRPYEA